MYTLHYTTPPLFVCSALDSTLVVWWSQMGIASRKSNHTPYPPPTQSRDAALHRIASHCIADLRLNK